MGEVLSRETRSSVSSTSNSLQLRGDNNCPIYAKIEKCINYDQERTVCDWTVESPRCNTIMNYTLFYTKGSSNKGEVFTPYCNPSGVSGESSEPNDISNKQSIDSLA